MGHKDPEKNREYQREWYRRRYHSDPEFRARRIAREGERWKDDPEYRARKIERQSRPEEKARARERTKRRYADNPEVRARKAERNRQPVQLTALRERQLWRKHGLRPEGVAKIWERQGGKCYLCSEPIDLAEVHIDHDHRHCPPGYSCHICRRGLAHHLCNTGIGAGADDPERLRRWADSLEAAQRDFAARFAARSEQLDLFAN